MRIETVVVAPTIQAMADHAKRMEEIGYDSIVTPEAGHDTASFLINNRILVDTGWVLDIPEFQTAGGVLIAVDPLFLSGVVHGGR